MCRPGSFCAGAGLCAKPLKVGLKLANPGGDTSSGLDASLGNRRTFVAARVKLFSTALGKATPN